MSQSMVQVSGGATGAGALDDANAATSAPPRHHNNAESSDDEDGNITTVKQRNADATKTKNRKREQAKKARSAIGNHFKLNWKWYLVGGIIFLAILLPILFKVILPAVVQLIVNQQSLPILSGSFLFQGTNEILVNLDSSFTSPLPATVDSFPLALYNKETPDFSPWLNLQVPPLKINGPTNFTVQDQTLKVLNGSEFTKWFARFVDEKDLVVDVRGAGATINLGILTSQPVLDKPLAIKGLDLRNGIVLEHLQLILPPKDGMNMKGRLTIPNRSPLTVGFGDYKFNVFTGDLKIGQIIIRDVVLKPGNNSVPVDGNLDLNEAVTHLSKLLATQSKSFADGKLELNVTGVECTKNGQRLTHIEDVLNHRQLTVRGSVVTLIADVAAGLVAPGSNPGDSTTMGSGFLGVVGDVFGNKTLLEGIVGHWNKTGNGNGAPRKSFAWI